MELFINGEEEFFCRIFHYLWLTPEIAWSWYNQINLFLSRQSVIFATII